MPWLETNPVDQRTQLIETYLRGHYSMVELSARFGISRKTAYKWLARFLEEGRSGLEDRSRAPHSHPHQTPQEVERILLEARRKHPRWGPRKIIAWLQGRHEAGLWPAPSTVSALFARHGLVIPKRRRRKHKHPGSVPAIVGAPNEIWGIDFKGHFRTRDGLWCYPLTVTDLFSRKILICKALPSTEGGPVREALEQAFRLYGLPLALRSDNGTPFSTSAIHGLSKLSAWWMRLGISHQLIPPASPQENGCHERMHRTLKAETCKPPKANRQAQQKAFTLFVREFNSDRPHEALGNATPDSVYQPSPRSYDGRVAEFEYPGHYLVKKVTRAGCVRFGTHGQPFFSLALIGEYLGFEEVDDGIWNVYFGDFLLGKLDERDMILYP